MDDIAPPLGAVPSVGRVRAKVLRRCSTKAETSIKQKTRWVIFQQALGGGSTDEDSPSSLKANQGGRRHSSASGSSTLIPAKILKTDDDRF
ncbi:hypothetical protein ACOSQ2_029291 [Xanthoceras sorbifolium]